MMVEQARTSQGGTSQARISAGHPDRPAGSHRRHLRAHLTRQRLIVGLAVVFGGTVIVNALVMQTGKHPSPMFRSVAKASNTFPQPPQRPAAGQEIRSAAFAPKPLTAGKPMPIDRPHSGVAREPAISSGGDVLMAQIQRELAKRGHYKGEADGKPGPKTTQAIRDFQFAQRVPVDGKPSEALLRDVITSKVTMKDELLDLVRRTSQSEPAKGTVADIQRALNKAGYGPVDEDGQLGPSTRQALARFEADRKLPPRGEPKGPVLKLLASASGLPIRQP